MQMENATRSPSFILPFFQIQDQPHKKWNRMLHMQMENATKSPSLILQFFRRHDQPHKNGNMENESPDQMW